MSDQPRKKKKPAVFLDRDGTLIRDAEYLSDPSQIRFYPSTVKALGLLKKNGYSLFVVTNQSGVARGYFPEKRVGQIHRKIQSFLVSRGAGVDGFFYCPHYVGGKVKSFAKPCACRKPKTGMVRQAAKAFPVDLRRSYVVGDKKDDLLLAANAGLQSGVLVKTGQGRKTLAGLTSLEKSRTVAVPDVLAAARWILRNERPRSKEKK